MASVELQLLSNILKTGDFKEVRKRGVTAAMFHTEEAKEVFRWLHAEILAPRSHGEVPSLERLRRTFPEFDYCPSRDSVSSLIKELVDVNVAIGIRESIEDMDAALDEGEDPSLVLQAHLPNLRELSISTGDRNQELMSNAALRLKAEYEAMKVSGGITGIPYPWDVMNRSTGGMQDEEWIVIYGRPKSLKTWVSLAMVVEAYHNHGRRVLCYSKEMSTDQMRRRAASIIAGVDYEGLKTGTLSEYDEAIFFTLMEELSDWEKRTITDGRRRAMSFISDRDLRGSSAKGVTVDVLAAEAEKFEADLLLVDGFYLMRDGRTGIRDRGWKTISNISSDLKDAAQYLRIPVIGTTQANRAAGKTAGDDTDELAFADAIGQDCDLLARTFKSKNLETGKPKVMLTFPGTRDSVLNPFVINAWPGVDFGLLQATVNVDAFLKNKQELDEDEDGSNKPKGGAGEQRRRFGQKTPQRTRIRRGR